MTNFNLRKLLQLEYHMIETFLSKILGLQNNIFLWKKFLDNPRNQVKDFGTRFAILQFWRLERKFLNSWTYKKLLVHRWIHKNLVEYINNLLNKNGLFVKCINNTLDQNSYFFEYINNSLNQNNSFVDNINNSLNEASSFIECIKLFRWILKNLINHIIHE